MVRCRAIVSGMLRRMHVFHRIPSPRWSYNGDLPVLLNKGWKVSRGSCKTQTPTMVSDLPQSQAFFYSGSALSLLISGRCQQNFKAVDTKVLPVWTLDFLLLIFCKNISVKRLGEASPWREQQVRIGTTRLTECEVDVSPTSALHK